MKNDAVDSLNPMKGDMNITDEKNTAEKACSVIPRGVGDVPLETVIKYADERKKMWDALVERYADVFTFNNASVHTTLSKLRYRSQSM